MRVPVIRNLTVRTANGSMAWVLDKTQTNAHIAFFYIECVCNAWFTLEILVSMSISQNSSHLIKALYHRLLNYKYGINYWNYCRFVLTHIRLYNLCIKYTCIN